MLWKIQSQLEDLKRDQRNDNLNLENLVDQVNSPFTDEIMLAEVLSKFKLPVMKAYDRTKDHVEHLDTFQVWMELHEI